MTSINIGVKSGISACLDNMFRFIFWHIVNANEIKLNSIRPTKLRDDSGCTSDGMNFNMVKVIAMFTHCFQVSSFEIVNPPSFKISNFPQLQASRYHFYPNRTTQGDVPSCHIKMRFSNSFFFLLPGWCYNRTKTIQAYAYIHTVRPSITYTTTK